MTKKNAEELMEKLEPDYHKKKDALKGIEFLFDLKKYGGVPYHQDGDLGFVTSENESKRSALRREPSVIKSIDKFMLLYKFDSNGNIGKDEYAKILTQLAKIFRPDVTPKNLEKIVEQDWEHDTKGKDALNRDDLFNSLFELADVWTPNIDTYEYAAFFDHLCEMLKPNSGDQDSNPYSIL